LIHTSLVVRTASRFAACVAFAVFAALAYAGTAAALSTPTPPPLQVTVDASVSTQGTTEASASVDTAVADTQATTSVDTSGDTTASADVTTPVASATADVGTGSDGATASADVSTPVADASVDVGTGPAAAPDPVVSADVQTPVVGASEGPSTPAATQQSKPAPQTSPGTVREAPAAAPSTSAYTVAGQHKTVAAPHPAAPSAPPSPSSPPSTPSTPSTGGTSSPLRALAPPVNEHAAPAELAPVRPTAKALSLPKMLQLPPAQGSTVAVAAATRGFVPPDTPPGRPDVAGSSGSAASGPGFGVTVAALIALFLLVAPRVGRRLRLDAALARPPTLTSLLERPG
jgi:hypothetical protein